MDETLIKPSKKKGGGGWNYYDLHARDCKNDHIN